ncbi:MAG: LysM peptidoglycan-binding domain-containing protein [Anaerolineae bacterium]|nr:LysM peptidoglycan-binding domain-containing protein [Anaerolineae bacterium]
MSQPKTILPRVSRWLILILILMTSCRQAAPGATPGAGSKALPNNTQSTSVAATPKPGAPTHTPTPVRPPITPTPPPTRTPPETTAIYYTVRPGDTLSSIAVAYGTTVEELMHLNNIRNADQLVAGKELQVALAAQHIGPEQVLIPDSDLVYGPGYRDFDVAKVTAEFPGIFHNYKEDVAGQTMTGPEIVQRIANEYSVGPRALLSLLELRGGWLTDADPPAEQRAYPLGYSDYPNLKDSLYLQLSMAADALNVGFYGWQLDTLWLVQTGDGGYIQYATAINAATAGVQRALAIGTSGYDDWLADLRHFPIVYRSLFGDPFRYTVEPLVPEDTTNTTLELPWAQGQTWHYTGGPHPGWGSQGAWSAIDFATSERNLGCAISTRWVTAAAPGKIIASENGMVLQDLDGDGFAGTGWVLLYLHMDKEGRVAAGTTVKTGDRIGHPSCEGGVSNATHLHFARRYNGVWIPADSEQWPLILSGWQAHSDGTAYNGTMTKDGVTRTAWESWENINAIRR